MGFKANRGDLVMKLRQCEICKCYLTDGEVNASQYDRYLTCFLHRDKPKKRTDWRLKNNKKATVLVLDITDGVVEFTEDRRVFRLSVFLFLSCFEECEQ